MSRTRLFRLPLDPDKLDHVREYFDDLEQERDVRAGTRSRGWTQEAAWPDETEPAIYLMHDEGESYPVGIDPETVDDAMLAIGEQHSEFFGTAAAGIREPRGPDRTHRTVRRVGRRGAAVARPAAERARARGGDSYCWL